MLGVFLLAALGGGYWYFRRRRRGMMGNTIEAECPGEMRISQDRPDLYFQIKATTLQEALAPTGGLYVSLSNLLSQSGYPCTAQQVADMSGAIISSSVGQKQEIAYAASTRVPGNLSMLATRYRQMGLDEDLSAFLNLAAIYQAEVNAAGASQAATSGYGYNRGYWPRRFAA